LFETLGELHRAGLTHRDIKPSNVLVDADDHVHVLDFGVVRFFGDRDTASVSGKEVLGTVPYMAPEQLCGLPFDRSVDLYAAATMLYESLAGPRPRPKTTVGWIPRICLERLVPLACLYREIPRGLSGLLERLLSADPRQRPTAEEAAREMRRLEAGWPSEDWPDAAFVDPGEWWQELEGVIGQPSGRPVQVLEGPTGSGRRRLAEQIHRMAVMQGTWPVHLHCRSPITSAGRCSSSSRCCSRSGATTRGSAGSWGRTATRSAACGRDFRCPTPSSRGACRRPTRSPRRSDAPSPGPPPASRSC
jgi:serine/threonine protein kinase